MSLDAVLIAGPTASGKSAAAMALAERLGGTLINTDSMQVYGELRVLTARPSEVDEARVPHRLYGHVGVREHYSAGRFADDAARALAEARAANRIPIFVGGTGLYFGALTDGLSPIPAVPAEIRAAMRARLEYIGLETFFAEFAARDPATAAQLRPKDAQRILRAAEVLEATGRPLSVWQKTAGKPVLTGNIARFVLAPPRAVVVERIERRFDAMLANGALDEVRAVVGLDPTLPAARALGVPSLAAHLAGQMTLEAAAAEAKAATRVYAKRQMTWFRTRMKDWKWLETVDLDNIITVMPK